MGGVSTGKFEVDKVDGITCYRMTGNVSTKNNGGFIQIRVKLNPEINSNDYNGIYIKVYGNEKNYNIHLNETRVLYLFYATSWRRSGDLKIRHKKIKIKEVQNCITEKLYRQLKI